MTATPHRRRRRLTSSLTFTALLAGTAISGTAGAAYADGTYDVPHTDYELVAVSSESDPYPAPPAIDGTALAAFDGDFQSQWTSRYADEAPYPHWISLDLGQTLPLTAADYAVKPGQNGAAGEVAVYVTNSATVAAEEDPTAWGEPVGTATLTAPETAETRQRVDFDSPVEGRYLRFQLNSGLVDDAPAGSAAEIIAVSSEPVPEIVDQPEITDFETVNLVNGDLTATVATEFPQVVAYTVGGEPFAGRESLLDTWTVNGQDYSASTTSTVEGATATYTSAVEELGVEITSTITVTDEATVTFAVTDVTGDVQVNTLGIPGHSLLSATSATDGVELDRTTISPDSTQNADQYLPITATTAVDDDPVGAHTAFLVNGPVVGGVETNATVEARNQNSWNQRLLTQVSGTEERTATIASNSWVYEPSAGQDPRTTQFEQPQATVYFAGDLNGDGHVTWHDGGIRARDVVPERLGAERVPERVVNRIPFNFASQATNPFEMTLDNTIRLANSTDELGQWVLEKGFGAEGHDSANTDYGGNYNERAGGLAELNELVDLGADLNADFTVHVNATEIYPQANSFDPAILQTSTNPSVGPHPYGWNWLDQSYYIDQDVDLGTGRVLDRFEQLSEEVPNLSGVYIDVYYSSGWVAEELADELTAMDLEIGTEWSDKFVGNAVWAHWPNDLNYGGATNKGINSTMVRFIHNSDADIWNADPLLGNQRLVDAEGWTGNRDWNTFYEAIWTTSLPTKFVQHFDLLTWEPGTSASLTGDVAITMDSEERVITLGGAEVLRGDDYLLPWQSLATNEETGSPLSADKMYFFTLDGGDRTFDLTERFADVSSFDVYRLTDTGRVHTGTVTPDGGRLTLTGDAATPYVVVPTGDQPLNEPLPYGAASELADPGFNSGSLEPWNARGPVELDVNAIGDNVATFGPGRSSISQQVTGLEPGQQYTFSAHVEIAHDALRPVTVGVTSDGEEVENTFDLTPAQNKVQADAKRETYSQRASVSFTAPDSGEVTVQIAAEPGRSEVTVDAARVFADTSTADPADLVAHEDYEGNQPGWGLFYKGPAGGSNDPRTSISVRNDPYTSAEWRNTVYPHHETGPQPGMAIDTVLDGDHSLSVHNDKVGLLMRTAPSSVSFEEGHRYRVELDYQTNGDGAFRWVVGGDEIADGALSSITVDTVPIPQSLQTSTFSHEFTGGCGQAWVGLERLPGDAADLVLDNVRITDLGEDPAGATCATLETPDQVTLNPATANVVTTTFTNTEDETVTNVGTMLDTPEGWLVQVAEGSTNLVETLAPDESAFTTWVLTPPAEAAGTTEALQVRAQYLHGCTKTVTAELTANTATRSRIPSEAITVTASSEETNVSPTRGPAVNMLDGDPSSIWHSRWTSDATSYPHVLTFDLGTERALEGISYLRRPANQNGPIKDYLVEVSSDGDSWTQVAEGAWENTGQYQDVDFDEVNAQFVRVTALNSISGTKFAAVAEMVFYGTPDSASEAHDPESRPEDPETACTASPEIAVAAGPVQAGGELAVTLTGFTAKSDVTLTLGDRTIGTASTDTAGSLTTTVSIPTGTAPGTYMLSAAVADGSQTASTEVVVTEVLPGPTTTIELSASVESVEQGGSVTVTAIGADSQGNTTGDVTDEVTLSSDVATDVVDGATVTFPTASPHTITGTHLGGAVDTVVIEVIPEEEPTENPDPTTDPTQEPTQNPDPTEEPTDSSTPGAEQLSATGATGMIAGMIAIALLLAGGSTLLLVRRRRQVA